MVPAGSIIDRSGVSIDPDEFRDVMFAKMPTVMRTVMGGGAEAITLGERIFVQPKSFDAVIAGAHPGLVVHELVHVSQWRSEGVWFLPKYVGQYLRFRLLGAPHSAAYRAISFEVDAFAAGASAT